jgi:hypothetical protein
MTTVDRLVKEARQLSGEERAELVDRLCELEPEVDSEWAAAWAEEARLRLARVRAGEPTYSREEVMEEARERIRHASR